jgi:WD40-like Beta Propeller Repeat
MKNAAQSRFAATKIRTASVGLVSGLILALAAEPASADYRPGQPPVWGPGELVVQGGGCPIETPDALSLMFASGRSGGSGDIDIWVIDRSAIDGVWSNPKNLPDPVNSSAADFCPAPVGRNLFFVSARAHPDACGGGDIYMSRQSPAGDWGQPVHLPCAPEGPNTAATERSPSFIETWYGTFLFYSTSGPGGDDDIHVSFMRSDATFGPGHVVEALSMPGVQDQMPTVREHSGSGFEVTFNSDRPGTYRNRAFGGQDAYWSRASFLPYWWSEPRNAGPNVNTADNETRASLSVDLQRLYVGRGDIYVSERE